MTVDDAKFASPSTASDPRAGTAAAAQTAKKDEAGGGDNANLNFQTFATKNPARANQYLDQLAEITGVHDRHMLTTALDRANGGQDGRWTSFEDRLPAAIDWILENRNQPPTAAAPSAPSSVLRQQNPNVQNRDFCPPSTADLPPAAANSPRPQPQGAAASQSSSSSSSHHRFGPTNKQQHHVPPGPAAAAAVMPPATLDRSAAMQQQQQASSSSSADPSQPPPNSPVGNRPKLVDLTEGSDGAGGTAIDAAESDLQKAIKLSLQESRASAANFGGNHFSQEDQDVSRALEASLMDTQMGGMAGISGQIRGASNWVDPLNPHDRERNGLWPVGLKNVGQTCWFSAVIQSLFYIPAFRKLVLGFRPTQSAAAVPPPNGMTAADVVPTAAEERSRKIGEFMAELRKIFALLLASERKYVDPSKAVEILRRGFAPESNGAGANAGVGSAGGVGAVVDVDGSSQQQEDVSEFTHILFAWMEEAFNPKKEVDVKKEESMEVAAPAAADKSDEVDNPISRLIYGRIQVERRARSGEEVRRGESFTQHSLQVNTFADIHESLDNSTAEESLDDSSSQERWFTQLPPVLFFSLSRFQFNVDRRVAEKIHNRLEFPELLYMDRYMSENRAATREKRRSVAALKRRREELQARLKQFTDYGSEEGARMPLGLVLQYAMDFAGSTAAVADISMASPHSGEASGTSTAAVPVPPSALPAVASSSLMQVDSPCQSPSMTPATSVSCINSASSADGAAPGPDGDVNPPPPPSGSTPAPQQDKQTKEDFAPMDVEMMNEDDEEMATTNTSKEGDDDKQKGAVASSVPNQRPYPRHVSEEEHRVIQSCMARWKAEVESDVAALTASVGEVDAAVAGMYSEPELNRLEYRLHAVMVHEGSVNSGHYWAYVLDPRKARNGDGDAAAGTWLKFNDNAVTEATWEELQKESVGGHSTASAYSLVYLRSSKSEMLLGEEGEHGGGGVGAKDAVKEDDDEAGGSSSMEQGSGSAVDLLLSTLPSDLAEYVAADNRAFQEERAKWDLEQEQKREKQSQTDASASGSNGDLEVLEERLTYVNTHAGLASKQSLNILAKAEAAAASEKPTSAEAADVHALNRVLQEAYDRAKSRAKSNGGGADGRLESFVAYLIRNGCPGSVTTLALLEQFCLPGLENRSAFAKSVTKQAETRKARVRSADAEASSELRDWHQAYHTFRMSAHCFVKGADAFAEDKFERALEYLSSSYSLCVRNRACPPKGDYKCLRTTPIVRLLCRALCEANATVIKRLKLGDKLAEVRQTVLTLIAPVIQQLEARVNRGEAEDSAGRLDAEQKSVLAATAAALEAARNEWCVLLGDAELEAPPEVRDAVPDLLQVVLSSSSSPSVASEQPALPPPPSGRMSSAHMTVQEDHALAETYAAAVARATASEMASQQQQQSQPDDLDRTS